MKLAGALRRNVFSVFAFCTTGSVANSGSKSTYESRPLKRMSSQNIDGYSWSAGGVSQRKLACSSGMRRPISQQVRPYTMMK